MAVDVNPYPQAGRPVRIPRGPVLESWPNAAPYDPASADPTRRGRQPAEFINDNLLDLFQANFANRDRTLLNTFMQLDQPGYRNVLEAQQIDPAVQDYYQGRQGQARGLYATGLENSGAVEKSRTGLEKIYGEGLVNAGINAQGQEAERRQNLLNTLQEIVGTDANIIDLLGQAQLGNLKAEDLHVLLRRQGEIDTGMSVFNTLAALVGGAAGAGGAGSSGGFGAAASKAGSSYGLSGASGGAVGGALLANQGINSLYGSRSTPDYSGMSSSNFGGGGNAIPGRGNFGNNAPQQYSLLNNIPEYRTFIRAGGPMR